MPKAGGVCSSGGARSRERESGGQERGESEGCGEGWHEAKECDKERKVQVSSRGQDERMGGHWQPGNGRGCAKHVAREVKTPRLVTGPRERASASRGRLSKAKARC